MMKLVLNKNFTRLLLALLFLGIAYLLNVSRLFDKNQEATLLYFEKILHEKEKLVENELLLLEKKSTHQSYESLFKNELEYYQGLFRDEGFIFFIHHNDSLLFWTNNFAPVNELTDSSLFDEKIFRLGNGWYEVFRKKNEDKTITGLLLLKTEFPIENKYLSSRFQDDFALPGNAVLRFPALIQESNQPNTVPVSNETIVHSYNHRELCTIEFNAATPPSLLFRLLLTLLNITGFIFLVVFIKNETARFAVSIGNNKTIFLFIVALIGLRLIALLLQYPGAFYEMPLFSPEFYATSFLFPSLGDFIINALLIFYISYYTRKHISLDFLHSFKRIEKKRLFYSLLFVLMAWSLMTEFLVKGLIENSSISFNINNLPELNGYSYAAILSIGLLLFSFYFICDLVVLIFYTEKFLLRQIIPAFVISAVPFIIFLVWFDFGTLPVILAVLLFSFIYFIYQKRNGEYGFANIVIIISIFSLLAAYGLIKHLTQKELVQRQILAEKLSIEEDPIAEVLYAEIEPRLMKDVMFSNLRYGLVNYDKEYFDNALREKYFSGYLSRYEVNSYLYRMDGQAVSPFNKIKFERTHFEKIVHQSGRPTVSENMIRVENAEDNENYIIRIYIKDRSGKEDSGVLYISMESKLQPEDAGFPELLLDQKMKASKQLTGKKYSVAKYRKGRLAEHYGKYNYSLSPDPYGTPDKKFSQSLSGGFHHLVFRNDTTSGVVISRPMEGWVDYVTIFSYLFAIFGITVVLFLNLRDFPQNLKMKNAGFNYKVQVMIVTVMVISMILFGLGSSYYIYLGYDRKNHSILSEKIHSVLIEVEHKLGEEGQLDEKLHDYISYILTKFSTVFFTDINLYDLKGSLLASSRPKLFNEGIISKQMDENAFYQMKYLQQSEFIQDEKIGEMDYHSAYMPFKNKKGEVLAYLNLPYFARQDTLEDEISSFLVALINIYVFLFAFSLVAALFISNAITRPLQYMQVMLGRVELGKTNRPIEYRGNDEIGRLVKVYNSKVAELEKSAELLARSERESAWREMAKQVAHEIKNPLTPMKLSVQHLQRALKENNGNQDEMIGRFTKTMIEQIDALSAIAGEFSNFAKMPRANNEPVDLVNVIENAVQLYKESARVKFQFSHDVSQAMVFADREQLSRVIINLVQNAIQAIPEDREGLIKISLNLKPNRENDGINVIIVKIEDNGNGISPEQMDKIFSPNFTTKSTGMGLGLVMVKNIIEAASGKIWFETHWGLGTAFYVKIPEWKG